MFGNCAMGRPAMATSPMTHIRMAITMAVGGAHPFGVDEEHRHVAAHPIALAGDIRMVSITACRILIREKIITGSNGMKCANRRGMLSKCSNGWYKNIFFICRGRGKGSCTQKDDISPFGMKCRPGLVKGDRQPCWQAQSGGEKYPLTRLLGG